MQTVLCLFLQVLRYPSLRLLPVLQNNCDLFFVHTAQKIHLKIQQKNILSKDNISNKLHLKIVPLKTCATIFCSSFRLTAVIVENTTFKKTLMV